MSTLYQTSTSQAMAKQHHTAGMAGIKPIRLAANVPSSTPLAAGDDISMPADMTHAGTAALDDDPLQTYLLTDPLASEILSNRQPTQRPCAFKCAVTSELLDQFMAHAPQAEIDRAQLAFLLAHLSQHRNAPLNCLVLVHSTSRHNVKLLFALLEYVVGKDNTVHADQALLAASDNTWQRAAHCVLLSSFPTSALLVDKLVSLVESPQAWIYSAEPGCSPVKLNNLASVVVAIDQIHQCSHYPHLDQAAIVHLSDVPLAISVSEFRAWLSKGGLVHVRNSVANVDLSMAASSGFAARLDAMLELQGLDQTPTLRYLQEAAAAGIAPMACDLVNITRIVDFLNLKRQLSTDAIEVQRALVQLGARSLGQRLVNGRRPVLWAIRQQARWLQSSDADISTAYVDPMRQGGAPEAQ